MCVLVAFCGVRWSVFPVGCWEQISIVSALPSHSGLFQRFQLCWVVSVLRWVYSILCFTPEFNAGLWERIYGNVCAIVALLTRALVVVSSLLVRQFIVETAIHHTVCVWVMKVTAWSLCEVANVCRMHEKGRVMGRLELLIPSPGRIPLGDI